MSQLIPFKYIDRQINDHIVYILALINPKIRTEAFNNMLSILKEYKIHNNKHELLDKLKKLFNYNYLRQQYKEEDPKSSVKTPVKTPVIESKQSDQHQTKKNDIAIQTEPIYNYNRSNLKYLPKTYKIIHKIKSNLKQLYQDFRFVFGKKK
jgi:hypothetical protein